MSKDNGLSDEADAAIAEAVRIVNEDKLTKHIRTHFSAPKAPEVDPKPTDPPPPKPTDPPAPTPEPTKGGRSLWWGDRLNEPEPEPKKEEPNA